MGEMNRISRLFVNRSNARRNRRTSSGIVAIYSFRDVEESKATSETRDVRFLACGVPRFSDDALHEAASVATKFVTDFCGGRSAGLS